MITGNKILFSRTFSEDYSWLIGKERFSMEELRQLQSCINAEDAVFDYRQFEGKSVFVTSFRTEAKDSFSRPIQALSGICFEGRNALLVKQLLPWMLVYFASHPDLLRFYSADKLADTAAEFSLDQICAGSKFETEQRLTSFAPRFVPSDAVSYRMRNDGRVYPIGDKPAPTPPKENETEKTGSFKKIAVPVVAGFLAATALFAPKGNKESPKKPGESELILPSSAAMADTEDLDEKIQRPTKWFKDNEIEKEHTLKGTRLYYQPAVGESVDFVEKGTEVTILAQENGFSFVEVDDDVWGWVESAALGK